MSGVYSNSDNGSILVFDSTLALNCLVCLLIMLTILYTYCMFTLTARRNMQPLKNKGVFLIIMSIAGIIFTSDYSGNFMFSFCLMLNKIINNAEKLGGKPLSYNSSSSAAFSGIEYLKKRLLGEILGNN